MTDFVPFSEFDQDGKYPHKSSGKLINDSRDVGGNVLRRLYVFRVLRGNNVLSDNRHKQTLSSNAVNVKSFTADTKYKSHAISGQSATSRGRRTG